MGVALMKSHHRLLALVCLGVALSSCGTRPREFDAVLAAPPTDQTAYLRDFATCRLLVLQKFNANTLQQTASIGAGFWGTPIAGFVVARSIRSEREGRLKRQMQDCLTQYGYAVTKWQTPKRGRQLAAAAPPAAPAATAPSTSK